MAAATPPDAPFPQGIPPDITPVDVLIDRLGDEARQQGELLLDSAEVRARKVLGEAESRAENAALIGVLVLIGAYVVLRK